MPNDPALKLSICIPTFNRATYIGATLESIIIQATDECEIVVSDNASTDETELIVMECTRRFRRLRYIKQDSNIGPDRNFDCAVDLARGEYCWLFSDDDLLKPGAVSAVLKGIDQEPSLIIVNAELKDVSMSKILRRRWLDIESDRRFGHRELDHLFIALDEMLWYVGGVVIKREIWISRERRKYYGSLYIHVAVIYQAQLPGDALVIATPLISYREGNTHSWGVSHTELLLLKWPSLVESMAVSSAARNRVKSAQPWRNPTWLLLLRAFGIYSMAEYQLYISPRLNLLREKLAPVLVALCPGILANSIFVIYFLIRRDKGDLLLGLRRSPNYFRNWKFYRREHS